MSTGKGDKRRLRQISREEETLRYKLACRGISFIEFEKQYEELKKQGKIYRRR